MSHVSESVVSEQGGESRDGNSCSPTAVVSTGSPRIAGDPVDPKPDVHEDRAKHDSLLQSPNRGCKVLTEEGLKELLYTSCSSDSPEFESIINLYLDQVKSHSSEIASLCCETCETSPLKTIFEYSGVYSKLDLKNFVRLGPSTVGYPSASWGKDAVEDVGDDAPKTDGRAEEILHPKETQFKLKLRITRETHPTPEDLRNDIVLKMIVVEEVNKKGLMGPLRAYLSPEGEVEFHTGSSGQKEGLEDYLERLSGNLDGVAGSNELDLKSVVSAIIGCPFQTNINAACGSPEKPEDEIVRNGELACGLISKFDEGVTNSMNMPPEESSSVPTVSDQTGACSNPEANQSSEENDQLPVSVFDTNNLEAVAEMVIGDALNLKPQLRPSAKPPLWHRGVDLTEIFSETDSDSENEDVNAQPLPTSADLKILQLLRSSSSASDVSGASAYSQDDIDDGLRGLASEKDDSDSESSTDDDEGATAKEEADNDHLPEPFTASTTTSDEAAYSAVRSLDKLNATLSLKGIGLQVIDPMGLDVISQLRKMNDSVETPKKLKTAAEKSSGKNPGNQLENQSGKSSGMSGKKTAPSRNSGIIEEDAAEESLLKNLEKIASTLRSVTKKDVKSRNNKVVVTKDDGSSQKLPQEKTVPAILGKMPEPVPQGFSRHLSAASGQPSGHQSPIGTKPAFTPIPHSVPTHPALGVPLVMSHQSIHPGPGLLNPGPLPNQGRSVGPIQNFQAVPRSFAVDIFARYPEEFGRHVTNALNSMGFDQRARTIEVIGDLLLRSTYTDRMAPQNGSNPAHRVQFNPVRPSTRPPFAQSPYSAANVNAQHPTGSTQNWPPAAFPQMGSLLQSAQMMAANSSHTRKSQRLPPVQLEYSSPINLLEMSPNPSSGLPQSQAPSSKSSQSSVSNQKPKKKASPSKLETGKTSKMYWETLKSLRAAKKAAKKAHGDPKFSGTVKNKSFSVYPSSRKSTVPKAKTTQKNSVPQHAQNVQRSTPKSSNESSSALRVEKPNPVKPTQNPAVAKSKQNKASGSSEPRQTDASNAPKPKPTQAQGPAKPKAPNEPAKNPFASDSVPKHKNRPNPTPKAKPPAQNPRETASGENSGSKKTPRSQNYKKKQSAQPKNQK